MDLEVRSAGAGDWLAIETLCRGASRALPKLWWWEEYLTEDLFLVVERKGAVVGALFAWPDDSPVAWVRLAVLEDTLNIGRWLDVLLPSLLDRLRRRGVQELAWMDSRGWATPHLKVRGFTPFNEVVTLVKFDRSLPDVLAPQVCIRPASDGDIGAITAVDQAAFTPHWRYSEATMQRKLDQSLHFTVAELAQEVVGYAEGELHSLQAHLNRIAVHPDQQGNRIGACLLRDAILTFWHSGARRITLNTQADNQSSQRLYLRFGFELTGDRMTAWTRVL